MEMSEESIYKPKREYRNELSFDIIVQKNNTRQDLRKMLNFTRTDPKEKIREKMHAALDDILNAYFS